VVTTVATVRAIRSIAPGALMAGSQRLDDRLEGAAGGEELDALGLLTVALRGQHRGDRDAVDVHVGIGSYDVADLAPAREQRSVEAALRLTSAGGAPRPRAIGARAGQLDFDPAGHG
jgi:hypothetical protein